MTELLPWHQPQWDRLGIARSQERMPHALLLSGAEGLGKLDFARLLGKSLLCDTPGDQGLPCGVCRQCKLVEAENHPDLQDLEPEEPGKAIKIDVIRKLVEQSVLSVTESRYRVFIIHPTEAMGVAAANALLKTLEEPIQRTLLILISANPGQLLATIRSRCQQLLFVTPPTELAQRWLSRYTGKDQGLTTELLKLSRGAPLLARQLAEDDQLAHYNQLMKEFLQLTKADSDAVHRTEQWLKQDSLSQLMHYMQRWLMDLIRLGSGGDMTDVTSAVPITDLKTLVNRLDLEAVYKLLDDLCATERQLVNNINPQLALERLLLQWVDINRRGVR